ncbi:MAG: DUF2868 domain-containing protein [Pseudomonadota bacterium]|nr:DUF2868 domain-containing protein [Pseudomonadota bacterium]
METKRSGSETTNANAWENPGSRWSVADLIDYETFLNADERKVRESPDARREIAKRDRALYLEGAGEAIPAPEFHTPAHRRETLHAWLDGRRRGAGGQERHDLPGETFTRSLRMAGLLAILAGLGAGTGITAALLRYDGETPVNVSWYVFVLVLPQLAMALAAAVIWLLRRSASLGRALEDLSWGLRLVRSLVAGLSRRFQARVPQNAREDTLARGGVAASRSTLYQPVSTWTFLVPLQAFGVAFNVAVIVTTVALLWFSDRAFGWQSTLDVPDQTVYSIVRTIALPWRPIAGEGRGYPGPEQVKGSRIYLNAKKEAYDPAHLRSWRWFLVLSVSVYGLLPRLALLAISLAARRRALAGLSFRDARSQALYRRLVTPSLDASARASGAGPEMAIPRTGQTTRPPLEPRTAPSGKMGADECLLILHVDVRDVLKDEDDSRLLKLVGNHTGWRITARRAFGASAAGNRDVTATVATWQWLSPPPRVMVVDDGSQPPITEHLRFLKDLRMVTGAEADITLALVGEATDSEPLPPVTGRQLSQWRQKIDQLADPYLHLVSLASLPREDA